MALAERIHEIHDEYLALLDERHDYYVYSKLAWRLIQQQEQRGLQLTFRNLETDHTIDGSDLSKLSQRYVTGYLASTTFQDFVSLFEQFIFDFLRIWLVKYPDSLREKEVAFGKVLDSADKNEIVDAVIEKKIHELGHKKINDWFDEIEKITQLKGPSKDQMQKLVEIKASRDIFVHSKGVANHVYVTKSGGQARAANGKTLDLSEKYHRDSWQLIKLVVSDLAESGISKLEKTETKA